MTNILSTRTDLVQNSIDAEALNVLRELNDKELANIAGSSSNDSESSGSGSEYVAQNFIIMMKPVYISSY